MDTPAGALGPTVELLHWPAQAAALDGRREHAARSLLVIQRGSPIPAVGDGEDWVWADADEREVASRLRRVAGAELGQPSGPAPVVPADLPIDEHRAAVRLVTRPGTLVRRAHLAVDDPDATMAAVARALRPAGWSVLAVGRAGFVAVPTESPSS